MKVASASIAEGQRFGMLVTVARNGIAPDGRASWLCRCDCGAEPSVSIKNLANGKTNSCGCLRKTANVKRLTSHKMTGTKTYAVWASMVQRCTNPKQRAWASYGGSGIGVSERWMKFDAFFEDMGQCPPGGSIDRIDNALGYSKENCRWVPRAFQSRNRKSVRWVYFENRPQRLCEIAEQVGIHLETLRGRLDVYRMTIHESVAVPLGKIPKPCGDFI